MKCLLLQTFYMNEFRLFVLTLEISIQTLE